ncbi:hypothetical protein BU17DRAFT_102464 [Hysterangium stoloniferum]|nr:hypothetical protein BU17DRAFT_102464 [Hysterangium stoloniferum]
MTDDLTPGAFGRRIVTGLDADTGKAQILYDDTKGHVSTSPNGNLFQVIWWTDEVPADCSPARNQDPTTGLKPFQISNEGSVAMFGWLKPGACAEMHETKSIDYVVLLEGELELELDNGEKRLMKPGDVIVQRETIHAWCNPLPTQYAKVFAVMVASKNAVASEGAE